MVLKWQVLVHCEIGCTGVIVLVPLEMYGCFTVFYCGSFNMYIKQSNIA